MEQKKKKTNIHLLVMLPIGAAILIAGIVMLVMGVTKEITGLTVGGLIVGVFGGIFAYIAYNNSQKICNACGEKLKNCDYQYEEVSQKPYQGGGETGTEYVVAITAECPNCGAVKTYNKKFRVKRGENIQYKVDSFCRSRFGH